MLVHLLVLWSFSVVEPTLSGVQVGVDFFFPLRRIEGWLFVITLIGCVVIPPVVLWLLGLAIGRRSPRWRWRAHLASLAVLGSLLAAYEVRQLASVAIAPTVAIAIVAAGVIAAAYARFAWLRSVLTVLAPAPLVFLLAFLFFSKASHIVFPGDTKVPAPAAARATPVVVLVLDEFPVVSIMGPGGRVDRARFPNFARLAADSTWYRTALSASWTTTTAVPAIMTGQRPSADKLPLLGDHPENVFTLLRRPYREHVIESFTRLCPLSLCPNESSVARRIESLVSALTLVYANVVSPRREATKFPNPGNTWGAVLAALDAKRRIEPTSFETSDLRLFPGPQFDRFLEEIHPPGRGPRKPFYLLHSNLPHNPYNHLPSGKLYRNHNKEELGLDTSGEWWTNDTPTVAAGWQRHLLQTQYTDGLVGRLMRRLKATGLYDRALVIVVADHGASFIAGNNRRRPRGPNVSDIAMVPLFVKAPRQARGRIVDAPVSTLDVLPTIADEVGIRIPWRVDGMPLRRAERARGRAFRLLSDKGGQLSLQPGRLQQIRQRVLDYKDYLFGRRGSSFFDTRQAAALFGQPVARFRAAGRPLGAKVHLQDSGEYDRVDPSSPLIPALVRGTIDADRREVTSIAIAVNGRVWGTGTVFGLRAPTQFSVIVPQRAFVRGRNSVQVLALRGSRTKPRLVPLGR
jgi:hypothetical protein